MVTTKAKATEMALAMEWVMALAIEWVMALAMEWVMALSAGGHK